MSLSAKNIRRQLAILKPLLESTSLDLMRRGQNKIGELMAVSSKNDVIVKNHSFDKFNACWILPRDERRKGVLLYLHGGGYCSGDIEYAKGFGTILASRSGTAVFTPAYRLAPENPFPAALDDALESYNYLINKGYTPDKITLVGESAGGGLCYSLALKLREERESAPAGIIAISPWTDMCATGSSYKENEVQDPTMSIKALNFYKNAYTTDFKDPLVSPLYGDLSDLPPSLIFAGADEIMKSDAEEMHKKLKSFGCESHLYVKPQRWHAYILYNLKEDKDDFDTINHFLNRIMAKENKLRWMRLDNAAKIYPAARRQNWSNVFRVSVTLTEAVDKEVLKSALDVTVRRFPSIATRLKKGVFWYYLEQIVSAPNIMEENSFPLTRMTNKEIATCAFRVIAYDKRIAFEVFHALTDGTGAIIFLKTLTAEYLCQKYGIAIPHENGILPRLEEPDERELEDSFLRYSGKVNASRRESNAWHLWGTPEKGGFLHLVCFKLPLQEVSALSKKYGVSVNTFLTACMMKALCELQKNKVHSPRRRKPIKVLIPVNLRRIFDSRTMRNFAYYTTPEIDPRLGEYTFEEICSAITHRVGLDVNEKQMSAKIASNVNSERSIFVRIMPLFIKNIVMKAVFDAVGEKKSCITLSNLGKIVLPEIMSEYVERFDFILGVQATAPHNCGVITFGDTVNVNFIRNIREPELEASFFKVLQEMGINVEVESNLNER